MNSEFRTKAKPVFIIIFFSCIFGLSMPDTLAQQSSDDSLINQTRPRRVETLPSVESRPDYSSVAGSADPVVIAYAAYAKAFSPEPAAPGRVISSPYASSPKPVMLPLSARNSTPAFPPRPAASTAPMTVGEKFHAWFKGQFLTPGAYFGAVARGMWFEFRDNDDFKKDTFDNYLADSMTRAARSFASSTANGFYEKALLASIFKQDPRYHRSNKTSTMGKLVYAATRVFVTQGDRCGCDQFNVSFLLGGAMGAVTANAWERSERTGPVHTTTRYLNHIWFKVVGNILREFISGQ